MPLFLKYLRGAADRVFYVGAEGVQLSTNSDDRLEVRNPGGDELSQIAAARPINDDEVTTYLDLKERAVLLSGGFNAASPGFELFHGKYLLCHTGGGLPNMPQYIEGAIYKVRASGAQADQVPMYTGILAVTTVPFVGNIGMDEDSIYCAEADVTPFQWRKKAGGGGGGYIDHKVSATPDDPLPGYLSNKVDNSSIVVDFINRVLKVKDGVFVRTTNDENVGGEKTFTVGIRTDWIKARTDPLFDAAFDPTAKRWKFKVAKGAGVLRAYWGFDVDLNGDLMPFTEDD
jgi:hypothetical protein